MVRYRNRAGNNLFYTVTFGIALDAASFMKKTLHIILYPIQLLLKGVVLLIVYFYRYGISPMTPASCRHVPTCSEYMVEAIRLHGPFKGLWLGLKRLSKCHPWGTHGYDPVPPPRPANQNYFKKMDTRKYRWPWKWFS